jgi:hypothetical protein
VATRKDVWVSIDDDEFETELEATLHDFHYVKANEIQELITNGHFDECLDWTPANFAIWIAQNFEAIKTIIEET